MEKYFNLTRFSKYFRYNLSIHYKAYFITCIILLIGLVCTNYIYLCSNHEYKANTHVTIYTLSYCLSAILVIGTGFPELRTKSKTIYFLTIPASVFEKYLVQFFIRTICFTIIYHVLFWVSLKLAHHFYMLTDYKKHFAIYDYNFFSALENSRPMQMYVPISLIIAMCLMLFTGSIIYKKHTLFKTVFTVIAIPFGIYVILLIYSYIFHPGATDDFYPTLYNRYLYDGGIYGYGTRLILIITITSFTSLLLIPFAYFKLKEKEL
ncbi:hypothetical protein [Wenyingzhuangia marina]|uniref:ABC-2 family transporter protein n=1 Tax=Wenyingzhuangia marina TaxID=1195760 RepID=A0A1M5V8K4_9FLAO|nr:hypothetical protein [Wenyingzhuangia marina]GGF73677.1 hypothetical protein GCM10011397_15760 [Wenyingzhuangia marina]SHH71567.1 hypothetical protein SAMN05444281_1603 [Wenyingzhuangia marina]